MQTKLKELRRRGDLTQIELAQRSGVPRSRIQLAEAGTLDLRPGEWRAIRKAVMPALERTAELLASGLETLFDAETGVGGKPTNAATMESSHE